MTKFLKARKIGDEWLVNITITHIVKSQSDVMKMIKYEGLKYREGCSDSEIIIGD